MTREELAILNNEELTKRVIFLEYLFSNLIGTLKWNNVVKEEHAGSGILFHEADMLKERDWYKELMEHNALWVYKKYEL